MNQEGILVPRKKVSKTIKPGQTRPFWERDWDEGLVTEFAYVQNKQRIQEELSTIRYTPSDKNIYVEVSLKEKSKSKTSQPDYLWKESELEIVESKDPTTLTLSGSGSSLLKLQKIIESASFDVAKTGNDVTGKDRDMYRELYAVSAVRDLGQDLKDRTDSYVKERLHFIKNDEIKCLIELRANLDPNDYDVYFDLISGSVEGRIHKRDVELFFSNMSYLAELKPYDIKGLLGSAEFRFIRVIKRQPSFIEQRSPSNVNTNGSNTLKPLTDLIVGIVDSGVDNNILNNLRANHLKTTSLKENKSHGTFVASRVLFGHDLTLLAEGKINALEPIGKFFDVQVMGEKLVNGSLRMVVEDDQDLIGAVEKVVKRHRDIKVYNISIAEDYAADPANISDTTIALDELSHEYDVLFILSAGNHQAHKIQAYDKIFSHNNGLDVGIASPGDSVNSLTVGAVAYEVGSDAMAPKKFYPSPFTRIGNIRNGVKKPELVEEGGNYISDTSLNDDIRDIRSVEKYGVIGLSETTLIRNIGTSFSAPLITNQALLLQDYISNQLSASINVTNNYSNLIRAMLIHSTYFVKQPSLTHNSTGLAVGFGLPNFETLFTTGNDRITMTYCEEIDLADKVHTLRFKVPPFLVATKSRYVLTLAYNPPVDKNFNEYNMVCLKPSLRVVLPEYVDPDTGEIKQDTKTIMHGSQWRNSRNERGTVCHYTSVNKTKLETDEIELYLQMKIHKKFEEKYNKAKRKVKQSITQPYAVVLSVIDESHSGKLRSEVLNSEQFELVTRAQIEVPNV